MYNKRYKLLLTLLFISALSFADVGNQNRYSDDDFDGGDDGLGVIIGYLIRLCFEEPEIGIPLLIIVVIYYYYNKKKKPSNSAVNNLANNDVRADTTAAVAAQIQEIDPAFSGDKFIGYAREVFMKIQEAWTQKEWKTIRPFESETLFNQHKQQLDEYIRLGKTNVVEKIGIKQCTLHSFTVDGEKEVLVVYLSAVMRDYVIDDKTKKVLESDPERDWYMKYEMVFNRHAGVKTTEAGPGYSITNCPNCGAPTAITSSGQCEYCGSVITNGEHDWVLTDIHSVQ
ncbi:MAG: TIM44-like domain-containing protein [Bacteroidales bacterium]|nr:TIM44-like domain-containing protein [Bacteroidales bacterium]